MRTQVLGFAFGAFAAACSNYGGPQSTGGGGGGGGGSGGGPKYVSEGVVTGVIRDTTGSPVAKVWVCAGTAFPSSTGGSGVSVGWDSTGPDGTYTVTIGAEEPVNARSFLSMIAIPDPGTGLASIYVHGGGDSVTLSSTIPPHDTTHLDVVVHAGTPDSSRNCIVGP